MNFLPQYMVDVPIRHDLVGSSHAMCELIRFIHTAAPAQSTVLIEGESGTGKELVAQALHDNSGRRGGPFVAVNCAALTETLLESELFGHEAGAFTGAVGQKKGKFEQASGGTLLLDEVGELSPAIQAKLLRALQQRNIDRIGGTRPVAVDIRLIAATNRNLESEVALGRFREDLYYRLHVLYVRTPPLRERPGDIPALAGHFIARHAQQTDTAVRTITAEASALLSNYNWPGNVRELENVIERALVLGKSDAIRPKDLPAYVTDPPVDPFDDDDAAVYTPPTTLQEAVHRTEREFVENALDLTGGNQKDAAELLGVHPKSMRRLMLRLGL